MFKINSNFKILILKKKLNLQDIPFKKNQINQKNSQKALTSGHQTSNKTKNLLVNHSKT